MNQELKTLQHTLLQNKRLGKEVVSIDYVLKKLREADAIERALRPPEEIDSKRRRGLIEAR